MTISYNPILLLVSTFLFISLLPSCTLAINITQTLSDYPDLSIFNHYLTETHLADKINNRTCVTILAVGNRDIAPLARLNKQELQEVMAVHVLYDYYDATLFQAQVFGGRFAVPNLLRYTQNSYNKIGFVHVTLVPTGAVYFSSAEPGSKSPAAQLLKSVVNLPVNISVLQISAPIFPLSLQKDDDYDSVSSTFERMTRRYTTTSMDSLTAFTMAEGPETAAAPATPPAPKSPSPAKSPKSSPSPKSSKSPAPAPKSDGKSTPTPAPSKAPANSPKNGPAAAPAKPPSPSKGPAAAPGTPPHSGPAAAPSKPPSPRSAPTQAPTPSNVPFPSPRSGPVPSPFAKPPTPPPESSPDLSPKSEGPAPSSTTTPVPAPADEPVAEEPSSPSKSGSPVGVRASVPGLLVAILLSSIMGRLI